ncbi:MAG: oligopeptide transporter, OPT family [Prevotella sp.]|nr:oligopeptide transporter, OPT family [Prevotella sp.]
MEENLKEMGQLPENAFRELKEGEEYQPVMSPERSYPEVNGWSVTWGVLMAVLFSAAAAYLGLKVGQVFEAAIPIAIIAVGVSTATKRRNALGENVIIQSIGACSGAVVAGAIFTLPAIYILQDKYPEMTASFLNVFLSSLLGGIIGILFLIPFRKYFVKDMHGKYPFPEATATTQVLMSGAKGGSQAKPLLLAGLVGGLYDFIVATFGWWNELFTSRVVGFGETLADKAKLVFKLNTGSAVLGLGFIIGLKYTFIICLGSLFIWWIVVPGMAVLFSGQVLDQWDPSITTAVNKMSPEQIFNAYGKSIGIGGIAMAGIIGIIKSWGIIKGAVSLAAKEMKGKGAGMEEVKRTQRDISFKIIAIGSIVTILITFLFFWLGVMQGNILFAVVGILLVAVIAFLFTTVAANAIAIVGSNPVSGMTLMTLILASVVMVAVGLKGTGGMVAALIMGGVVCTALSMAGAFITDLKIGYWLGTTPKKQEVWKFLGTLVSAATVGGLVNWFVTTRSKDEKVNSERGEKGTLIASGFIAGGALMGVVSALLRFGGVHLTNEEWLNTAMSEVCSLGAYICLIVYFILATRVKKN